MPDARQLKLEKLINSIHEGNDQKLREMIEKGQLPLASILNDQNDTALHIIVIHEKLNSLLEWILKKYPEVDINARNSSQSTPLIIAADHSNFEAVKLLIIYGAKTELKSKFNETARAVLARNLPKKLPMFDHAISECQNQQKLLNFDLDKQKASYQLPQEEKKELSSENKSVFSWNSFSFLTCFSSSKSDEQSVPLIEKKDL